VGLEINAYACAEVKLTQPPVGPLGRRRGR